MSEKETGGPAFPGVEYKAPMGGGTHMMTIVGGMTLRDYFAAKAMQAFITRETKFHPDPMMYTTASYEFADAIRGNK